jgi:hypothetical protein
MGAHRVSPVHRQRELSEKREHNMIRISKILIAAAIAVSAASAASAQSISPNSGTGNVLASHYAADGHLIAYGARSTEANARDLSLSPFAAVRDPNANTLAAPAGNIGYNELLAMH